jgi:hypothetical protein
MQSSEYQSTRHVSQRDSEGSNGFMAIRNRQPTAHAKGWTEQLQCTAHNYEEIVSDRTLVRVSQSISNQHGSIQMIRSWF